MDRRISARIIPYLGSKRYENVLEGAQEASISTPNARLPSILRSWITLESIIYLRPRTPENMDFFQWHWWAALAIVLFIAEIFVPGFVLFCLGIGCVGASLAAALDLGASVQLIAFSGFSLLAFFTVRPLLMKRMWKGSDVRTNVDALVGVTGRVTQDFDPGLRLGRVAAAGDDWRAECTSDKPLKIGDLIKVVRVESNTLVVKPVDHV